MTVEELINELVGLARRGRGQWEVRVYGVNTDTGMLENLEILLTDCIVTGKHRVRETVSQSR